MIKFGEILDEAAGKQQLLFGGECKNPCVNVYGYMKGKKCRDCKHLFVRQYSKRYYKCGLRRNTASERTDHRVNWPACGKWEAE